MCIGDGIMIDEEKKLMTEILFEFEGTFPFRLQ
jgi:hypothetical protein